MNKIISFGVLIVTALCTTPSYAQSTAEGRIVNIGVNFAGTEITGSGLELCISNSL